MFVWRKFAAIATLGLAMCPTVALPRTPVEIHTFSVHSLSELNPVAAPIAFRIFCIRYPDQCRPSAPVSVSLNPDLFRLMMDVNRDVNHSMRPTNERIDQWSIDVEAGDCEDFALTKRAHLLELGVQPGALRIAVAKTVGGEGHAVLVVRTSLGDLVLDNRSDVIRLAEALSLKWISMSSANPLAWFEVAAVS